jgi:hypothetical protein
MAASSALPPSARGTRLVTVMPTMLPGRADVRVVAQGGEGPREVLSWA